MSATGVVALVASVMVGCCCAAAAAQDVASGAARRPAAGAPVSGVFTGVVRDPAGRAIAGALVRLDQPGAPTRRAASGADGTFALQGATGRAGRITVTADGFGVASVDVARGAASPIDVVLHPAPLAETVVVTATRGTGALDTAAAGTALTSADLAQSPSPTLDDVLRATPGFGLFRRSSSRVANPTTQGVSLRGISASGASRTTVVADGLPLNDPFGSWVYWNRIPAAAIDRVEVVRGAAGETWGADALGGVVQVFTHAPGRPRGRALLEGGAHDTWRVSVFGGGSRGGWFADLGAEATDTRGVHVLAGEHRGPVDTRARSDYATGFARAGHTGSTWRVGGRAGIYTEDRGNGTRLQVNATRWRDGAVDAGGTARWGVWTARAAAGTQTYRQTFSAVDEGREAERLTSAQRVPSRFASGAFTFTHAVAGLAWLAGVEARRVEAEVRETRFLPGGSALPQTTSGGAEATGGAFLRLSAAPHPRLRVSIGGRADVWRSRADDEAASRRDTFVSPRGDVSWEVGPRVVLRGAAYGAHRVPTLNELHRGFRVGNVVTLANPRLGPERLTGAEGGALVRGGRWSARATAFWSRLDAVVANITVATTPALITRERRNADRMWTIGAEVEAEVRPTPALALTAMATLTEARFGDLQSAPELEGNRIPQLPRWQAAGGITYVRPEAWTVALRARAAGGQYEDDRNSLRLDPFLVVDAQATRAVGRGASVFTAVENVFDVEYETGVTPLATVGWPRTVRAGVRLAWR